MFNYIISDMKHIEEEREKLCRDVVDMWDLVITQLHDASTALLTNDKELAFKIRLREKNINDFELKIDNSCETFMALFSPVAIDLRLVIALLRINGRLERIGDFANGIARYVVDNYESPFVDLMNELNLENFFSKLEEMLVNTKNVFISGNGEDLNKLYAMDDTVDLLYRKSLTKIAEYTSAHTDQAMRCISMSLLTRRMERIGDHCSNIIEDLSFYLDAHIIKHNKA